MRLLYGGNLEQAQPSTYERSFYFNQI
jgi:hypothetical protein